MSDIEFVAGPEETEPQYRARIRVSRELRARLPQAEEPLPFLGGEELGQGTCGEALAAVEKAYGVRPAWVPVYVSSQGLSLWQGGASWILQLAEPDVPVVVIQLRRRLWGLYSRQELLQHELVHAGRVAFEEPAFEEFFAYRLSNSRLRRFLGPVFQTPNEALVFLGALLVGAALGAFYPLAWLVPVAFTCWGLMRLSKRHRELRACVNRLEESFPGCRAWWVAYRLTDAEIQRFARSSGEELRRYVGGQTSLRWRQILAVDPTLSCVT